MPFFAFFWKACSTYTVQLANGGFSLTRHLAIAVSYVDTGLDWSEVINFNKSVC